MDAVARRVALLFALICATASGEACLVKEGKPLAEIIVAEKPPRTTRLAARELQAYVLDAR